MCAFVLDLVLLSRPFLRSRDQDRDLGHQVSRPRPRPGRNELESRDHGLEITTLVRARVFGDTGACAL